MINFFARIIEYVKIMRIYQWYKNLVIFLPIFFAGELFYPNAIPMTAIGFISLALISSANYILNDIIDIEKDRIHPEKRFRPLASKKICKTEAVLLFFIVLALGLWIAFSLNKIFFIMVTALFILSTAYSLWLKKEAILDIIIISVNFVIRAISGAFIMSILISPWLIVCPLFVAITLGIGKRRADLKFMKEKASKHKEVLKAYNNELTNALMIISTTCLIMSYSLYALSKSGWLLITLPFAIYTVFRYYQLVNQESDIARNPERFYKDIRIVIALIIWSILLLLVMYFLPHDISTIFLK